MRVPLVGVQHHGIAVFEGKLLPGELLGGQEKLFGRGALGQREDHVVHLLGPPVNLSRLGLRAVLTSSRFEVPDLGQVLGYCLALEDLAAVGVDFELAVAVDVGEVGSDRCRAFPPPETLTMTSGTPRTLRPI
jgi:hypothetical protein